MRLIVLVFVLTLICPSPALAQATAPASPMRVPQPRIALLGTESYEAGGKQWTRYKIEVVNRSEFSSVLFGPAPDLPACGKNRNASRTWVDIVDGNGSRLYGFCALKDTDDLGRLWFAVEVGRSAPATVSVVLNDRRAQKTYRSDPIPVR